VILDTNAVSDFADGDEEVLRRLRNPSTVIHLPVIVLGEYRYGLKSSRQRAARERWLDELEASSAVLNIESATCRVYAQIRHELRVAGQPIPENDLWIAALARQHRLPVLSNDAHFDQVSGIQRVGW